MTSLYDLMDSAYDAPQIHAFSRSLGHRARVGTQAPCRTQLRSRGAALAARDDDQREEDRQRGLRAGVDVFLTKSSFQDATFLRAVEELIGAPV